MLCNKLCINPPLKLVPPKKHIHIFKENICTLWLFSFQDASMFSVFWDYLNKLTCIYLFWVFILQILWVCCIIHKIIVYKSRPQQHKCWKKLIQRCEIRFRHENPSPQEDERWKFLLLSFVSSTLHWNLLIRCFFKHTTASPNGYVFQIQLWIDGTSGTKLLNYPTSICTFSI